MKDEVFSNTKEYGILKYDEIFLYYDGPCIFSIYNKLRHKFICLLETENENLLRYVIAPVSEARYINFVRNNIPIREIFTKSEMGGVFTLSVTNDDFDKVIIVNQEEILNLNLPKDTEYLDIKSSYTTLEIQNESVKRNVPILQKSLEKNGSHKQTILAKELSMDVDKFQKVFDGLSKDMIRNKNISGESLHKLKEETNMLITGTYAASFGITIEGKGFPLIGEDNSYFGLLLDKYFELLDIDKAMPEEYYNENREALKALRDYYKFLDEQKFAIKCKAASPNKKHYEKHLSIVNIKDKYDLLSEEKLSKEETEELIGHWSSINYKLKNFTFLTNDDRLIKGKFGENFNEYLFDFDNEIKISTTKKVYKNTIGEEIEEYILLNKENL